MATISIFNPKGGVGKTTFSVNLALASVEAGYKTLLWEIDGQGDSNWIVNKDRLPRTSAAAQWISGTTEVSDMVRATGIAGLSIIVADTCMQRTDNYIGNLIKGQRLTRIFAQLEEEFDVIILDSPAGMGKANEAIMQFANLIVVPTIPAPLALKAMERVRDYLTRHRGNRAPMLPVFSMVDRRRQLHLDALAEHPDWPVVPMLSELERMSDRSSNIETRAKNSKGRQAFTTLWAGIQRKLWRMHVIRIAPDCQPVSHVAKQNHGDRGTAKRPLYQPARGRLEINHQPESHQLH